MVSVTGSHQFVPGSNPTAVIAFFYIKTNKLFIAYQLMS